MNFLHTLFQSRHSLPRVLPLMRDGRVPMWLKAATAALAILIVSPLDLLGDIPVLGLVDDVTLLALLASLFVRLANRAIDTSGEPQTFESEPVPVRQT